MYKIACQTIVFGDHIKENIETILPTVKKMGTTALKSVSAIWTRKTPAITATC